jgi:hypothetical protein
MSIQFLIDGMNAAEQKRRAGLQMTLGQLIAALEAMAPDLVFEGPVKARSYRGYYCDLAFDVESTTVAESLALARSCMGKVFGGYKGGDFTMGANTPIWVAEWGSTGRPILGLSQTGELELGDES